MEDAETEDDVKMRITGTKGTSKNLDLDDPDRNDNERGAIDTYNFTTKDVGFITKILAFNAGSDYWFVKKVGSPRLNKIIYHQRL